ncbi:MAG: hypothetical protein N0E44_18240 [Candidatus Thiodiazotropha lotti]|nr:hypothetical protein [Candidatus Thiodiazotropha lotti]MCW4221824.1 hypothetical protein [Candidatus Thiodiazotropha lotti]
MTGNYNDSYNENYEQHLIDEKNSFNQAAYNIQASGIGNEQASADPTSVREAPAEITNFEEYLDQSSNKTDEIYAKIQRDQYQYYRDAFLPTENAARGQIRSDEEINKLTTNAGLEAGQSQSTVRGIQRRNMGRFGMQMGGDQKRDANKQMTLQGIGNRAGTMARTRTGLNDINLQNRGEYVGLGRGISTSAQSALGDAASTENQTNAANDQIAAQEKAAKTAAMMSLAMMMM